MTDMLAHGIISGILSAGLSVPNDIAVMGCDGNPRAWGSPVPMTTMEPFGYEVGFTAVRLLTESIDDPEHHRHQAMVIPMHLVPRESTVGRVQILDALRC
jgi:LacI family transcriptional regulator